MRTVETRGDMIFEADFSVKMDDGITIRYDVYRPKKEGCFPAIVTYGPYSKGMHFSQSYGLFWKRIKEAYPEILEGTSGKYMNWETVDPEKWVPLNTDWAKSVSMARFQRILYPDRRRFPKRS
ncbi:MAG: hypothetical protein SOR72_06305 [Hornefia sp.]|nr:hypothetical protein [Hornefia sp.]